ncbi:MAG: glycosyltransferase [Acutalibacteraceae bacterium]|nr:glycosyltransferase [Acutalibacteraceae bacterium]
MPCISVIIPVYNVEKYLAKCVDSVITQTFSNYEIILVDDGSTDNSGAICDSYAEKHPFISVIHQQNKGLGGARNTGISAAKGEFLFFLDSDDFISNDALDTCYNIAVKNNCDMVLFDCLCVFEDGTRGAKYTCEFVTPDCILTGDTLKSITLISSACNRLYKKELFINNNISFPEKLWYEDLHTTPKLVPYIKTAYYYTEKPIYYYLQRKGSIMHSPDLDRIVNERLKAVNSILDYFEKNGFINAFKDELDFMKVFHGFFLPVREMQSMTHRFEKASDKLRTELLKNGTSPLHSKYLCTLSKKERLLLKWALDRNYSFIKLFSALNKLMKKVRNVK